MRSETKVRKRDGGEVEVSADDLATLGRGMEGDVLTRSSEDYEEFRKLWNGTIERRPALIARCQRTRDVVDVVDFTRTRGLELAIRGGGHNVSGSSSVEDGLVIDLRGMNDVTVDPDRRVAHVQGGATLGDLDSATQRHGLATPSGFVSDTGVAGLTLRGGLGHMMRRFGMTCDNLIGVELVTADGEVLDVDDDTHPDVMWALRGGPLDLGVVTTFRYRLHPVGPRVRLVLAAYPREDGVEVNRLMRDELVDAPPELGLISF